MRHSYSSAWVETRDTDGLEALDEAALLILVGGTKPLVPEELFEALTKAL